VSNTVFPTGRVNCPTGHVAVGGGIERGVGPTGELVFETLGASAGNAGWEFTAFSNLGEDWGGTLSVSCLLFVGPNPPDFKTVTVAIACDGGSGSDPNCSGFAACPTTCFPSTVPCRSQAEPVLGISSYEALSLTNKPVDVAGRSMLKSLEAQIMSASSRSFVLRRGTPRSICN
jgi:hypothetical protein